MSPGPGPFPTQVQQLRNELADATILVWKMQEAVNEGNGPTAEIVALAEQLKDRAANINGQVARWALMVGEKWPLVKTST